MEGVGGWRCGFTEGGLRLRGCMGGGCGCAGNKLKPDLLHTSRQSYWSLERSAVKLETLWNGSPFLISVIPN